SSRRRHTRFSRDWSSDVCSSDLFIAMEWVPGGHLEQRIASRGRLPEREVLPLAIQVAEGLMAAHAAGLIHRDIKPGNILFDAARSEERRVGKEWRCRRSRGH